MEIADEYRDRGVAVIGIAYEDDVEAVREFAVARAVSFPLLMDDGQVSTAFGVLTDQGEFGGVPCAFILNREGEVVDHFPAYRDKEDFVRAVERALGEGD
jgi:peroxiredoxin